MAIRIEPLPWTVTVITEKWPVRAAQLLQLLADAAQTPQRLVFLSGELELLELEDLQCEQNGAGRCRGDRSDCLKQPL